MAFVKITKLGSLKLHKGGLAEGQGAQWRFEGGRTAGRERVVPSLVARGAL
jgi:hypothetical protein